MSRVHEHTAWMKRRIQDLGRVFRSVRASPVGVHLAVPRLLRLVLREKYSPTEVLMFGMLGSTPLIREATFISKRRLLHRQLRINPRACFSYTEDKLVFFRRCLDNRLATPRVFAAVGCKPGVSAGVPVVESPEGLRTLLARDAPPHFVFKPAAGVHGQGVLALGFDGATLTGSRGETYSAEDVFAHAARSGYARWILQERVQPHRDLAALAGSEYLQTARVISYLDGEGKARIPIAWLRIIVGTSVIDNFNFGTSGNLVGTIDVATGRLQHVLGPGQPGLGLIERTCHPATGAVFADFRIPFMADIRDLVARAAHAFAPLRTIGWDVAITDSGPSLIEGNVTWDPLPTRQDVREVAESLR